jgi:hypothetical protein
MAEWLSVREVLPGRWRVLFLACLAGPIVVLPLWFLEPGFAAGAALWGLYIAVPLIGIVACAVWATRVPVRRRWVRPLVILVGVFTVPYVLWWSVFVFPYGLLTLAPAAVVAPAGAVAWRAPALQ